MKLILDKIAGLKDQLLFAIILFLCLSTGYYAFLAHDRQHMADLAKAEKITAEEKTRSCRFEVGVQNKFIADNARNEKQKDEEYAKAMAEKPPYIVKLKYVNTGDTCKDFHGLIAESMTNDINASGDVK